MSVIFLAGVHGVGKGFFGGPVAASLGIVHRTASQLIQEEKRRITWDKDKLVTEVINNQLALIRAVASLRETNISVLLDGHFTLWDSAGEVIRLPVDVFRGLELQGVLLICDDATAISARLAGRDGVLTPPSRVAALAAAEAAHAHDVCLELNIPLIVVESPNEVVLAAAVTRLLAKNEQSSPINLYFSKDAASKEPI